MNRRAEIANQVRDLLAYFPGRGWLPLAWLIVLPLATVLLPLYQETHTRVPNGMIPYFVFSSCGRSVVWMYGATNLVLLLRINHSARSSWAESAKIIVSSAIYGMILALPSVLISLLLSVGYVGISVTSMAVTLFGFLVTIGAMFLLAIVLGAIAHYAGFLIALILFLMRGAYVYLLPIAYSITAVPEKWRLLQAATPLAPAIAILRTGILNNYPHEAMPTIYWVAATIHAALGFGLAFWIFRGFSDHSTEPDEAVLGLQVTRP
jgi:ABC-type polysaccharide/polyol phosphate export permease